MPLLLPPVSPSGVLRYEWVDPGGTVRDLTQATSPGRFVSRGSSGLGMPPVDLAVDKLPFSPGGLLRHINRQPGRIELPITVIEDSLGDLVGVLDDLRGWFDTGDERGGTPGYLRVTRPDGTVRQVACYYAGGLEGDMAVGGPDWCTYVVSLLAPDPWPTEQADTVATYGLADFGTTKIVINQGQLDAYPIWTIMGPCTLPGITVANTVTGASFSLPFGLTGGLGVIVDTRPSSARTNLAIRRYPDDLNLFQYLGGTDELWRLAGGENRFRVDVAGATGATSAELRYRARYRGLLR